MKYAFSQCKVSNFFPFHQAKYKNSPQHFCSVGDNYIDKVYCLFSNELLTIVDVDVTLLNAVNLHTAEVVNATIVEQAVLIY